MLKSNPLPEKNLMIEIGFNQEKLDEEGEYTYEAMCNATLKPYFKENFKVMYMTNGNFLVYDSNDDCDMGILLGVAAKLFNCTWFRKYINDFYFYNFDEATPTEPCPYENLIKEFVEADNMYGWMQ